MTGNRSCWTSRCGPSNPSRPGSGYSRSPAGTPRRCSTMPTSAVGCCCSSITAAMDRLLAGKPERTDGRLIKDNLWKEAQVSRATMNRAPGVLTEWDRRTAATGSRTPGEVRSDQELAELRRKNQLAD
ncbi:hypothetical protein KUTG_10072 [Kutzneria sp. 744]|nr:hypothetical protein KUTG_10072 [Kutzneria sp. 744]